MRVEAAADLAKRRTRTPEVLECGPVSCSTALTPGDRRGPRAFLPPPDFAGLFFLSLGEGSVSRRSCVVDNDCRSIRCVDFSGRRRMFHRLQLRSGEWAELQ